MLLGAPGLTPRSKKLLGGTHTQRHMLTGMAPLSPLFLNLEQFRRIWKNSSRTTPWICATTCSSSLLTKVHLQLCPFLLCELISFSGRGARLDEVMCSRLLCDIWRKILNICGNCCTGNKSTGVFVRRRLANTANAPGLPMQVMWRVRPKRSWRLDHSTSFKMI